MPACRPTASSCSSIKAAGRHQLARVRRFIGLAVERLGNNPDFLLSREELARAAASGVALAG